MRGVLDDTVQLDFADGTLAVVRQFEDRGGRRNVASPGK
jgi:hypothetical protein